jgi:hypothetical protein
VADENKVLGIRLDAEERKRFDEFVSEEGKNNKDFLNTLLNLYELNKGKVKNINLVGDIETLEGYTNKIQQAFINVIEKLESQKEGIAEHSQKDLQIYKEKVNNLEFELDAIKLVNSARQKELINVNSDNVTLKEQYSQLQNSLQDKLTIIEEYKGKNDTLSGIIEEYKGYKVEIEECRKTIADTQAKSVEKDALIKDINYDMMVKDTDIEEMKNKHMEEIQRLSIDNKKEIESLTSKHDQAIENLKNSLRIEKDMAILELKQQEQEKIQKIQEENNNKINEYQSKYKSLLEELENNKAKKTIIKDKPIQK